MKKSLVAVLAAFAVVVSFAQSFAAPLASDLRVVSAQPVWNDPESIVLTITNRGTAATGACKAEVRFYGDNVLAMVKDQPIAVASAQCGGLGAYQTCKVTVRVAWTRFAQITGLKGPQFYFRGVIDADRQVEEERIIAAGADLGCGEFNNSTGFTVNKSFADLFASK